MGAGPSLGKFLKSMDDEDLVELVESAYKLEPQRMEKVVALAKLRYFEGSGQQVARGLDDGNAAARANTSTTLLSSTQLTIPSSVTATLNEMTPASVISSTITASSCGAIELGTTTSNMDEMRDASDDSAVLTGVKDPMNALWTFQGHPLRELQAANKNPQNVSNRTLLHQADRLGKNGGENMDPSTGAILIPQREVDADGYFVMYGSCGRDKRYGRCSVCYFRGLRCNTAHYCACCQRSVCIRPRIYPGEEHHKICWNVLHMDKDMIQRVEKKKKRKLQALSATVTSTASTLAARLKNVETRNQEDVGADGSFRQTDSLRQSVHRAPSIPTVVADVSGAVDL